MAKQKNYLLGYGERLTESVEIKSRGGDKSPPYSFDEAKHRLTAMLSETIKAFSDLPKAACPDGQVVASFTLHPEYLAKSYYPGGFFQDSGLRAVGSKPVKIVPERRSLGRVPESMLTTQYFVAGSLTSYEKLWTNLLSRKATPSLAAQLATLERIGAPDPSRRVKNLSDEDGSPLPLEVVLHAGDTRSDQFIIRGFKEYTENLGVNPDLERMFFAGRLCFLRMFSPPSKAADIAQFSFLRVIREMPRLRATSPIIRGMQHKPRKIQLPTVDAIDPKLRVAIFDGGINAKSPLLKWTDVYHAQGVGDPDPEFERHGEAVTSALLFGSIDSEGTDRPISRVDHYRVLDKESTTDPFELYDVLERIETVLDANQYEFISLSLGPSLPVDDDEVHAWTAVLDGKLSEGRCLATIAAGNTGADSSDPMLQAWRVQVPSDCVNGLTVGSANCRSKTWSRSEYSSRGPGRAPGIVKPDLVAFGGCEAEPFWVHDSSNSGHVVPTAGTSYSAPAAMRAAAGVRAHFGPVLSPLAIKALLIHGTEDGGHNRHEVGWGRLPLSVDDLTVCPDGCVRIVYQDEISAAKFRRIRIPLPKNGLQGDVTLKATFCFATEVDPQHPGNYTRSGLSIVFRPDISKFGTEDAVHPRSAAFFQPANLYANEQELRDDAHKWETCLHMEKRKRATSLSEPVFDIHYNARSEGHNDTVPRRIRYVLVITILAPRVTDLYDRVVRAHRAKIQPLKPIIEVPIRL